MAEITDRLVTWPRMDAAMEEALLVATGRARKVIQSMIAVSGGGTGGGGASVVGDLPIKVEIDPDGTEYLVVDPTRAAVEELADGSYVITSAGVTA